MCADSISELEDIISCVQEWVEDHSAEINYDKDDKSKVKILNETPAQKRARDPTVCQEKAHFPHTHYKILQEVTTLTYLGYVLDANMSMSAHCHPHREEN